jgi:hydrogenase maturation protease
LLPQAFEADASDCWGNMGEVNPARVLVLGLGNVLLQDEGLGVKALKRLVEQYQLPDNVRILDGGTLGMHLFPYLDGCTHLLILDAVETDSPPGTSARIEGPALEQALSSKLSMHQAGVPELLAVGRLVGNLPAKVVVCGLQPETVEWGLDLSPTIAGKMDRLVSLTIEELRRWGVPVERISGDD